MDFAVLPCTSYSDVITNSTLATLYERNAEKFGIQFPSLEEQKKLPAASTDMGNVSYIVPSLHAMYNIDTTAVNHTHEFTAAAASDVAHKKTLIAAKALAMTAIDVLCSSQLMREVTDEFKKAKIDE